MQIEFPWQTILTCFILIRKLLISWTPHLKNYIKNNANYVTDNGGKVLIWYWILIEIMKFKATIYDVALTPKLIQNAVCRVVLLNWNNMNEVEFLYVPEYGNTVLFKYLLIFTNYGVFNCDSEYTITEYCKQNVIKGTIAWSPVGRFIVFPRDHSIQYKITINS